MSIPCSVIVMTKNEEENLPLCLESLVGFAEVFVVDSHSTDKTAGIALSHGARLIEFKWNGQYPKKKQWCLENLPFSYDWVLYVDADEQLSPELIAELAQLLSGKPTAMGYSVFYDYVFLGRTLTHGVQVSKLILFNRHHGRFADLDDLQAAKVSEVENHYQPFINGRVGILQHRAIHHDHDNLSHYFDRHNQYSDWEAVVKLNHGGAPISTSDSRGRRILKKTFRALPGKPVLIFMYSYIIRLGFLDGAAGLHFAIAKAMYYWQINLKIRELQTEATGSNRHWRNTPKRKVNS